MCCARRFDGQAVRERGHCAKVPRRDPDPRGYGYTTEYEMERDLRDTISGKIYSRTSEIQKVIIAGFQGL